MRRIYGLAVLALFLALGLGVAACGGGQARVSLNGQAEPGVERLVKGQVWELSLASNPSTGYGWRLVKAPDAGILRLESQEYRPGPQTEGLVGSGGVEVFSFQAVGAGLTKLEVVYSRPWEKNRPAADRRLITVRVVKP